MDRRFAALLLTLVLWPALLGVLERPALHAARVWGERFGWLYLAPSKPPQPKLEVPQEYELPETPRREKPAAKKQGAKARPPKPPAARGIRVSRQTVLRLARARAIPNSTPVGADWPRPPGLRLTDVAHLGLGLRSGDVLTEVMGTPALNRGSVIAAVVAARKRRAPAISAEFWRGDLRYQLYVEMPYRPLQRPQATPPGNAEASAPVSGSP